MEERSNEENIQAILNALVANCNKTEIEIKLENFIKILQL